MLTIKSKELTPCWDLVQILLTFPSSVNLNSVEACFLKALAQTSSSSQIFSELFKART